MEISFSDADIAQIENRGLTEEKVLQQIAKLQEGIQPTKLNRPCTIGDGISIIDDAGASRLINQFDKAAMEGRISKFVPASGAASRMFQQLLSLSKREDELTLETLKRNASAGDDDAKAGEEFFEELEKFAFYDKLKSAMSGDGLDIDEIRNSGDLRSILDYLLTPQGLDYMSKPKGLIEFHKYPDQVRTPVEEQIAEAVLLSPSREEGIPVHFTVSDENIDEIKRFVGEAVKRIAELKGCRPGKVTFSVQKPSTDTIAADRQGSPFRTKDGKLLFRQAGHGALIENLNDYQGDIALIKNIDNVVPEHRNGDTLRHTKILAGYLIKLQVQVFKYLEHLRSDTEEELTEEIAEFARKSLSICITADIWSELTESEKRGVLFERLNRPLRVCGMVKNTGEPGGGPFWVEGIDGSLSLQIVETSQIDLKSEDQRKKLQASTHFNPVLLACGIRDYQGQPFNLMDYIDPEAGFISLKSYEGRELKALELPGLWNGAMAKWNTVFVEVPITVLNPVKTVNDLLREEHR